MGDVGLEADKLLEMGARLLVPGAPILVGVEDFPQDVRSVHLDRVGEAIDQRGVEPLRKSKHGQKSGRVLVDRIGLEPMTF